MPDLYMILLIILAVGILGFLAILAFGALFALIITLGIKQSESQRDKRGRLTPEQRATYEALRTMELQTGTYGSADDYLDSLPN